MRPSWWIVALSLTCLWFGGLAVGLDLRADIAEKQRSTEKRVVGAESRKIVVTRSVASRGLVMADTSWWGKFMALPAPYTLLVAMGGTTSLIWIVCYASSFLFRRRN
jgi:hypothetical protein